jgi:hypothetical protein
VDHGALRTIGIHHLEEVKVVNPVGDVAGATERNYDFVSRLVVGGITEGPFKIIRQSRVFNNPWKLRACISTLPGREFVAITVCRGRIPHGISGHVWVVASVRFFLGEDEGSS